jgi:hypothetical protein
LSDLVATFLGPGDWMPEIAQPKPEE